MFRVAFKSALARKGRLVLTSLAVIAGCAFLSGVFVFSDTIKGSFDRLFADAYEDTDAFVRSSNVIEGDFAALRVYFQRVLTALAESKFIVDDVATGADGSYVRWRWVWRRRAKDPQRTVVGVTHLRFAADGRITHHADLFDAAEGFYETLPVVGGLLRAIKRRL